MSAAAGVIAAALVGRDSSGAGIAAALEAAGLLQSPESAAELVALRKRVAELKADRADRHDDLAGALGHTPGTEWPDLISVAAAATASEARPVEDPHDSPLHHTYALGRDLPEVTPEPPAVTVARWNAAHFVGTPVTAYPGRRPEDDPKCVRLVTHTRSAASVLGGHTAVVWVEGHGACIKLAHVDPRPGGAS
ncbi:hypothetical protein [Streptomyces sp. NP10]|uniref:hypothetical protein n=1 Tax=Streptomyces sp. NP10 TaxID=1141731 RepID=UPI0018F79380|nr:hypothetical protein [Streptomyces sp. NP10]